MTCGVYIARDAAGTAIYVGSSIDIDNRLRAHTRKGSAWLAEAVEIERREVTPRAAAFIAESDLIRDLQPKYNATCRRKPKSASRVPVGTPVIKPNLATWALVIDEYGSDRPLAKALGVDHQTFSAVKRGRYFPSSKFIAAALALTGRPFDELFLLGVREADDQESVA